MLKIGLVSLKSIFLFKSGYDAAADIKINGVHNCTIIKLKAPCVFSCSGFFCVNFSKPFKYGLKKHKCHEKGHSNTMKQQ